MTRVSRLAGPSERVAPTLLGCLVHCTTAEGTVALQLTEVEAYGGSEDEASHAHRGPTARNHTMFGKAGGLYTYRSYGIHWCANVVTGPDGQAAAVLLRAGRIVEGEDLARSRRGEMPAERLARGPGNLCQALGIQGAHDGLDLLGEDEVGLTFTELSTSSVIHAGPRVGISRATQTPWRFWVGGDNTVSSRRRPARRPKLPS